MRNKSIWILLFIYGLSSFALRAQNLVLFSKAAEGSAYYAFMQHASSKLLLKSAYGQSADSILYWLKHAKAIVITGGEDIHPARYKQEKEISICGKTDTYRDSLEYVLFQYAFKNRIPFLGICRGEQYLNVALGGSLHADIPRDFPQHEKHFIASDTAMHRIHIDSSTLLFQLVKVNDVMVNSFHHQCVHQLGKQLRVAAMAPDGVIEAIEYTNTQWHAIGVQWHPERLPFNHPAAGALAKWLLGN